MQVSPVTSGPSPNISKYLLYMELVSFLAQGVNRATRRPNLCQTTIKFTVYSQMNCFDWSDIFENARTLPVDWRVGTHPMWRDLNSLQTGQSGGLATPFTLSTQPLCQISVVRKYHPTIWIQSGLDICAASEEKVLRAIAGPFMSAD